MGNATTASVTGVQVAPAKSAIRDLPIAKVWAFAVGQFGWALLSGIISNWLVYFYQPDQETISQGQTVFVPQGLVVLGIVTVVGGITAFARFFDAFVDPAVASLSDRCDSKSGRRMPFLKFAALPLAVVTVLVFWSPINGTSWVNAAFLFVTVIGYYIALTFYCTPYNALIAELGHDSKQQLTISTAISFTWVAGTAIAYVAPVIWGAFVPMMGRITAIRVTFTIMAAVAFAAGHPREGLRQLPSHLRIDHRIPEADVRRRRIPQVRMLRRGLLGGHHHLPDRSAVLRDQPAQAAGNHHDHLLRAHDRRLCAVLSAGQYSGQ